MDPRFQELEATLEAYFLAIDQQKSAQPPALMPLILKLDQLGMELHPFAPPMLQHYLERKSYAKALNMLRGNLTEHVP